MDMSLPAHEEYRLLGLVYSCVVLARLGAAGGCGGWDCRGGWTEKTKRKC